MKTDVKLNVNNATILDVVGIVFLILKLCGLITWSWTIVLLPFIIEAIVVVVILSVWVVKYSSKEWYILQRKKKRQNTQRT